MDKKKLRALFLLPIILILIFPIVMVLSNSFMSQVEMEKTYYSGKELPRLVLVPKKVSLDQYIKVLIKETKYLNYFWNSIFITVFILIGQVIIASMAAFAFSIYTFKGKEYLFFVYIMVMMMPFQVTLVPNYIISGKIGLLGNWSSMILPGIFSAFGVFLLRQFMSSIPKSYIEAARQEGVNDFYIYTHIVLPLSKSGIAALILLAGVDSWNMVEQPLIFLHDANLYPLSLILSRINLQEAGIGFAASFIFMIPFLLLFLHKEESLISGITNSGVKG
ncbi:MAG: carbohydrate ABC transporter permease [Deltaproteobacteria bacterium]|nr:carbohydrate ABC transporter permease [Deltaproteobacteria bacterium]